MAKSARVKPAAARRKTRRAAAAGGDDGTLGRRVASLRRARGLTLRTLSARSGISESMLSRLENRHAMINAHSLLRLAAALEVDIAALFQDGSAETIRTGRRTVTRSGAGVHRRTDRFRFELLCADLAGKKMVPSINRIAATTLADVGGLRAHPGEEFIFVLAGPVVIHTEFYEPMTLDAGDSLYIDSTMAHAYTRGDAGDEAIILVVATRGAGEPDAVPSVADRSLRKARPKAQ